jgi:WD40 repeat protein
MGVLSVVVHKTAQTIIVGCGDGSVVTLALPYLNILKSTKLIGSVTSLSFQDEKNMWAGTSSSNMYLIGPSNDPVLTNTCHYAPINDIAFPEHSGDIFATASDVDVRIWNLKTCQELLRVAVPNLECQCITFKKDGTSLITGWSDGKIRAFGPQSGRLQYQINDAHKKCVTALAVSDPYNDRGDINIVSGGEGMSSAVM